MYFRLIVTLSAKLVAGTAYSAGTASPPCDGVLYRTQCKVADIKVEVSGRWGNEKSPRSLEWYREGRFAALRADLYITEAHTCAALWYGSQRSKVVWLLLNRYAAQPCCSVSQQGSVLMHTTLAKSKVSKAITVVWRRVRIC